MISRDFLFYALGIGFLVLVGFASYTLYTLSQTLKELSSVIARVDDVAKDVDDLKNSIKSGILSLIAMFIKKGGVKNGK